jgi:hypothetical protein
MERVIPVDLFFIPKTQVDTEEIGDGSNNQTHAHEFSQMKGATC